MSDLTPERERILQECLRLLDRGASVDDCLARYPDDADALRPLLELRSGLAASSSVEPPAAGLAAGRSRLLTALAGQGASQPSPSFLGLRLPSGVLVKTVAGAGAAVVIAFGALSASAAGGFEPARQALEPARDVLHRLRIVSDRAGDAAQEDDRRPSDGPGEVDVELTPAATRDAAEPPTTPVRDIARPSPTDVRDARPTATAIRDARPTPTLARDAPSRPVDRLPSEPTPEPVSDLPTPARDVAPHDSRSGEAEPTPLPSAEQESEITDGARDGAPEDRR